MAGQFVHLHTHTHYSLLDGMSKVPELLDKVKDLGMDAIAMTDHGVLYGAIEFYKEAKKRGLKPIIGMETYVAPRSHKDKTAKVDTNPYHLVLLAKNNEGYQNLMKLSSIAQLDGYYYKPRVDKELLRRYGSGIIALSGCFSGEVARNLNNGNKRAAYETALEYQEIFGKGNYYIEIQDHPDWEDSNTLNEKLIELSKEIDIPLVLTRDSHYVEESDKPVHDILLCIQTGKTVNEVDRFKIESDSWITDPVEAIERFKHVPEAVANTVKIAEQCNVEIELGGMHLPEFEVPNNEAPSSHLRKLCYEGLARRYAKAVSGTGQDEIKSTMPGTLAERLEYELSVIEKMGFESYFLIVQDFINWAKARGIVVGPGRGSGAGSIVAYTLNITDIDPIKYNLLFERFLNPDRISMPDFDIDFQDDRRDEVIQYVTEKYGADRVAHIITFGSIMARNAIRDTGRALGMSYTEVDGIAKLVKPPRQGRHIPLKVSIAEVPELKDKYDSDGQVKRLLDLAMRLEGVYRHASTHAAGVVISKGPITDHCPVQRPVRTATFANQTQYAMGPVEEIGLLKMDFLGLANLTILKNALNIIEQTTGDKININELPLEDKETFGLLSRGETMGVFQLESDGMRKYLKELKPTEFEDITAMVSLYRPGPMQWIGEFIGRKHGRTEIKYEHPLMEAALKNTYGIIVYQEQVMQIARDMCGFTGGQADTLRKAMGKKIKALMVKMRVDFVEGASKNGVDKELAGRIFTTLEDFSAYAFNKSHAACYAMIAYQTAYLKAHYPAQFMAALMTSEYADIDKVAAEVDECKRMGIEVLPPDVNESNTEFTVVDAGGKQAIRFGLIAVKNIGTGTIEAIVEARSNKGKFKTIDDFARRISAKELNRKVLEALIKCGAMDSYGERGQLLANIDKISDYSSRIQRSLVQGQMDIFGEDAGSAGRLTLDPSEPLERAEKLAFERELLGLYISDHPLKPFEDILEVYSTSISKLNHRDGESVTLGGIIGNVHQIFTKNNEAMAFIKIEDLSGSVELVVFPKIYKEKQAVWVPGKVVLVTGRINTKDKMGNPVPEVKILVNRVKELTPESITKMKKANRPADLVIAGDSTVIPNVVEGSNQLKIIFGTEKSETFKEIKGMLIDSAGDMPVLLSVLSRGVRTTIKIPLKVNISEGLIQKIESLLGKGSAVVS